MLTKKYELLVFDWDGTLVDSSGLIVESVQKAVLDVGGEVPEASKIGKHIGTPLSLIHQNTCPAVDYDAFVQGFIKNYTEEKLATHFFPGAIETLRYLKDRGFVLAIATNKPRRHLEKALEMSSIKDLFVATKSPDDGFPKPHPGMMIDLLDEVLIDHENALMIGDTVFDMEFAQAAKVDALAVCYGQHKKDELFKFSPVGFIDDIKELKEILKI